VPPTRLVISPGIGIAPFGPFGLTKPPALVTVLSSGPTSGFDSSRRRPIGVLWEKIREYQIFDEEPETRKSE
jgi:hypothetical protein